MKCMEEMNLSFFQMTAVSSYYSQPWFEVSYRESDHSRVTVISGTIEGGQQGDE